MTDKESKKLVKFMKNFIKTLTKEQARVFLIKLGTHTPTGRLTKYYR